MKRLLAFILLLSHMNTSMFLPQAPEQDVYDANGNQIDDITSIVELVRVKLGYDHHSDDENDDSGQNFHVAHCEYTIEPFQQGIRNTAVAQNDSRFFDRNIQKLSLISYDIIVPPPKA